MHGYRACNVRVNEAFYISVGGSTCSRATCTGWCKSGRQADAVHRISWCATAMTLGTRSHRAHTLIWFFWGSDMSPPWNSLPTERGTQQWCDKSVTFCKIVHTVQKWSNWHPWCGDLIIKHNRSRHFLFTYSQITTKLRYITLSQRWLMNPPQSALSLRQSLYVVFYFLCYIDLTVKDISGNLNSFMCLRDFCVYSILMPHRHWISCCK